MSEATDDIENLIRTTFPSPVAAEWGKVRAAGRRATNKDWHRLLEVTLGCLAAQLLADYARGAPDPRGEIVRQRAGSQGLVGTWGLIRSLVSALARRSEPAPFLDEAHAWLFARPHEPSAAAQDVSALLERLEASNLTRIAERRSLARHVRDVFCTLVWWSFYVCFEVLPGARERDDGFEGSLLIHRGSPPKTPAGATWTGAVAPGRSWLLHARRSEALDLTDFCRIEAQGAGVQLSNAPTARRPEVATNVTSEALWPGVVPDVLRFELLDELGRGGFGKVYRARDRMTGALIALKLFHPLHAFSYEGRDRIAREVRAMQSINHPRILHGTLHEQSGLFYLEMRLMQRSLAADLVSKDARAWDAERLVTVAEPILEVLAALQARGKIHCDLKPENLLVDDGGHVYLADFGLVEERADDPQARLGRVAGTPAYMAPEQWLGHAHPKSDVYALARVLHELHKGHRCPREAPGTGLEGWMGRFIAWLGQTAPSRRPHAAEALAVLRGRPRPPPRRGPAASPAGELREILESGEDLPPTWRERLEATFERRGLEAWARLRRRHVAVAWPLMRTQLTIDDLLSSGAGFVRPRVRALVEAMPAVGGAVAELSAPRPTPAAAVSLQALIECLGYRSFQPLSERELWSSVVRRLGGAPDDAASEEELFAALVRALGSDLDYRRACIPKRSGAKRWLDVPCPPLALVQSTIAAVLQDHVALPATAVAFARRRSPLLHALQHAGARQTVAVDIHDYFGSVSAEQVRDALREEHEGPCKGWSEAGMDRLLSVVTIGHPSRHIRYLPQGASSSPVLANLVGLQLDRVVRHKVGERPWRGAWQYSRYADDLVLSVPADVQGHDFHDDARKLLHDSIRALRWIPAPGKTRHFSSARGGGITLCGLQVPAEPTERPRLPREVERRVRAALHNAQRGEISPAARGLLAYAYSMTGRHALAVALPGEARKLVSDLGYALGGDGRAARELVEAWTRE